MANASIRSAINTGYHIHGSGVCFDLSDSQSFHIYPNHNMVHCFFMLFSGDILLIFILSMRLEEL